jgi:uroporphyrinogen-III synthase
MRLAVTRPLPDGERTAATLRARGHEVLLAPVTRIEPVAAEISGAFAGVLITSANAARAVPAHPGRAALVRLPVFAVGARSAEAAREAGFTDVRAADGDARDLVRLVAARSEAGAPLLYLAGEDRAADLSGELKKAGIAVTTVVAYRAVALPLPPALVAALKAGAVDGVLHFSARSAALYLAGAESARLFAEALRPRHYCLSSQVSAPLVDAAATNIAVAARPDETALFDCLGSCYPRESGEP